MRSRSGPDYAGFEQAGRMLPLTRQNVRCQGCRTKWAVVFSQGDRPGATTSLRTGPTEGARRCNCAFGSMASFAVSANIGGIVPGMTSSPITLPGVTGRRAKILHANLRCSSQRWKPSLRIGG